MTTQHNINPNETNQNKDLSNLQNQPRCLAEEHIPWMASHLEWIPTGKIKTNRRQLRKHKPKKVNKLTDLIKQIGFVTPLLVDENLELLDGHALLSASKKLGLDVIPVIRLAHLTKSQKSILTIAVNKFGEQSDWDELALAEEFQTLLDLQLDIELTGFEIPEVDLIIQNQIPRVHGQALDDCPCAPNRPDVVSQIGDLWICGNHRVLCGDACNSSHMARLMRTTLAHALITDSPFNLKIEGFVSGRGKLSHHDFVMGAGEMSDAEFLRLQRKHMETAAAFLVDGALVYSFIDWRNIDILLAAGKAVFGDLKNICVWSKSNAGMGSLYRSQHELIVVFKHGHGPHRNNIKLGKYGRNRSNVWVHEGANSINPARRKELALHPTVKPAPMIADIILDCTGPGEVILDPFLGSGTALIAAEDTGRHAFGMELDPKYVDVIVRRWQELTGEEAILDATGQTFEEIDMSGRGLLLLSPPAELKGGGDNV